uniref:Uncharacterized protein n=1 Tax=Ciona savignyi TaxID=51511 RepID=H2YR64_CIOSA
MALLTKYKSAFSFARRCRIVNSVRTYLSEEYAAIGKSSTASNIGTDMPSLCLSLDRCHEREFPISSLMIDRLVETIESPDHLHGSKYYLHKFRFSENGYYLRPWTVHTFVEKCLKFDPEVLIDCLKNKKHYGIFPNQLSFNKTLNHFMKKKDLKSSIQVLTEMFLFEMLDNKSCQSLCLKVLSEYWKENLKEGSVIPEFDDVTEWRNVAGVFYCVGKLASLPSIKLIGESLLGLIELKHGIRTVYQEPWVHCHGRLI